MKILKEMLITYLAKEELLPSTNYQYNFDKLSKIIQPCDIILVEGKSNFSKGIKYLTQSIWSHSAIYLGEYSPDKDRPLFEADIQEGVRLLPLDFYRDYHVRICRPRITIEEKAQLAEFLLNKIDHKYDLKLVFDLMKYLIRPPVPNKYKKFVMEFGSNDASKVICSSIIAEAFQSINYPILPQIEQELYVKKHYKLITPSDFDKSPFFEIIKPTLTDFKIS